MKEREISLIDLIFYILLRWRAIVAAMLIGAVVLAGFGFVRSNQSYEIIFNGLGECEACVIDESD